MCLPLYHRYKSTYSKLEVYGNVSFVDVYVFAGVHFLYFDKLKMRFPLVAPFVYRKHIINKFGRLDVIIRVAILNIYKYPIFSGRIVQKCVLETSSFKFKCDLKLTSDT